MKEKGLYIALIFLVIMVGCSVDSPLPSNGETEEVVILEEEEEVVVFEKCSFPYAGVEWGYRKAEIGKHREEKLAVIMYLHGGSSRGTDNEKQMSEPAIDTIANYLVSKQKKAVFIVPQCPDKDSKGKMMDWVKMASVLKGMLDAAQTEEEVSVYLFGGSMGGTGTWNMLSLYPHYFCAAMPCAGNPKNCDAAKVAQTPVYTVMGGKDRVMKPEEVKLQSFLDSVAAYGGEYQYDIEEEWDHETTCKESYTTQRLDWVFAHY
ncbi:MAG: hypothetical protein SOT07_04825 [Paludibacteraceae bacterium]|nr:hypothetical protein [Paludibacteraceae bacterium]